MITKKTTLCIVETMVVNIFIYYFFYKIHPNQDMYLELNPHPLLALCIFIGMRYGNYLGIVSAIISSIFYVTVFLKIHGDVLLLFGFINNYKNILLMFWTTMIFGTFKDNYKAYTQRLINEKSTILENYKVLEKHYEQSQQILKELKKQIINSEESILNLYEIASRLETLDSEEIYTEAIGILSKYLKADSISIYSYDVKSGYMRLKISIGNTSLRSRSMLVSDSNGFNRVVLEKKPARWVDFKEEEFPLMSAPLTRNENTVAVVNIEQMDFDDLSEYAYHLFVLIMEWLNKALAHTKYVEEISGSKYIEETNLMKYDVFLKRLESEERRKEEFELQYSLLTYHVNSIDIRELSIKLLKVIREFDVVSYDTENELLFILLPATPWSMSYVVDERIQRTLIDKVYRIQREDIVLEAGD